MDEFVYKLEPLQLFKRFVKLCGILLVTGLLIFAVMMLMLVPKDRTIKTVLYMGGLEPKFTTDERYLSLALDSFIIADNFKNLNFTSPRLLNMMKALSPAYLRIGGTMADRIIFSKTRNFHYARSTNHDGGDCAYNINIPQTCDPGAMPNFTLTALAWLKLNKLAETTNLDLLFDLNALQRFDNGSFDPRNAEELISFSARRGLNLSWELGNEPNAWRRLFNYTVSPQQLGDDFRLLRSILNKYELYKDSVVVGPDVTRPEIHQSDSMEYLAGFLEHGVEPLDAITVHHYYFAGQTAIAFDFINIYNFEMFRWQLMVVNQLVADRKPIWLGETSSAYGGGAVNLSDRFIASFLWLDKLGLAASYGLKVVVRQSLLRGHYALITDAYQPTPDWWVSVIYKKLVSNKVVDCYTPDETKVRLYCHCTSSSYAPAGRSVTVFGVNISNLKAQIRFEAVSGGAHTAGNATVGAFMLTTVTRYDSKDIYLNGARLVLNGSGEVPELQPRWVEAAPYVEMPPFSLGFWVVPVAGTVLPFC